LSPFLHVSTAVNASDETICVNGTCNMTMPFDLPAIGIPGAVASPSLTKCAGLIYPSKQPITQSIFVGNGTCSNGSCGSGATYTYTMPVAQSIFVGNGTCSNGSCG